MSSFETVPVLRSLPTTDGVATLVGRCYDLDVTECVLVRSFVNDVYEVRTARERYVLKVYHHGGWSTEEVTWEAELVDHLVANDVPVAMVVPLTTGDRVGEIAAPEGPRPFMLSEYVAGRKPRKPFDDRLYYEYGRLVGRMHAAGHSFSTTRHRRSFGLERTLDEPLARILPEFTDQPKSVTLLTNLAVAARHRLTEFAAAGMDRGVRHGDVTMDNVHRTSAGLVMHDFDLAHVGWRVADLSGCLATPFAAAFRAGYTEVRSIGTADIEALPWLRVVETIGNLAFHLSEKAAWRGTESRGEGWIEAALADLRTSAERLL